MMTPAANRTARAQCLRALAPQLNAAIPPRLHPRPRGCSAHECCCHVARACRFMCRYFSGFFFRHPLLDGFEYYWRMEPKVRYFCNLPQDPFAYMQVSSFLLLLFSAWLQQCVRC